MLPLIPALPLLSSPSRGSGGGWERKELRWQPLKSFSLRVGFLGQAQHTAHTHKITPTLTHTRFLGHLHNSSLVHVWVRERSLERARNRYVRYLWEKAFPCIGVCERWGAMCVLSDTLTPQLSVLISPAEAHTKKSTVNMNHQTLLLLFLPRLNCVFVTASSGDLFGNFCLCVIFSLLDKNHVSNIGLLFVWTWCICMCIAVGLHRDVVWLICCSQ